MMDRDQAALWVARMDAGDWTLSDEVELQAWIDADPRRRGALLQAHAAWITLDPIPEKVEQPSPARRYFARRGILIGGGGALAASFVGGLTWLGSGTAYQTELGEVRRVPLADGSIATINTASDIVVKLVAKRREVRIKQGEAWFQVAKDSERPFVVQAGQIVVQAVGTAFSVRRRGQGADILVNEGIVEAWAANADGNRVRLVAGQRAFVADNAAIEILPAAPSSVDRALAWRGGMIDLTGETLTDAIGEFNRYNRRKLVLSDSKLGGEQFDGIFRTDDPEGFAMAVRSSLDIPVNFDSQQEIRIGRAPG